MSIPSPQELTPDARRGRFLKELTDHCEDAGGEQIGERRTLVAHFANYAKPRFRARLAIVTAVAIVTSILPSLLIALGDDAPSGVWVPFFVIVTMFILMPILIPGIVVGQILGNPSWLIEFVGPVLIVIAPVLFWTATVAMLLFGPPAWLNRKHTLCTSPKKL